MSRPNPGRWHLIAGEYPPLEGGIGDYSAIISEGLAAAGAEVHVWTTGAREDATTECGVTVHRAGSSWSRGDLTLLGRALDAFPGPRRLLVQYAPNAWGRKGMNLGFCRWLVGRSRRGDRVAAMVHEIWYIPNPADDRPIRRLLPWVQRPMARRLLAASDRVYVSTPRWAEFLAELDPIVGRAATWLPVPSNIPVVDDPSGSAEIRRRVAPKDERIVGSFGTFANAIGELLAKVLPHILSRNPGRVGLLIGRNGREFAGRLLADHPELEGRLIATGGLPSADVSRHLRACDLLIQPYPDGVCGRRTTLMACLAHGVAAITTEGAFTSPIWRESAALAMAPEADPEAFIRLASTLLDDHEARARLGRAGRELYDRRFAVDRTIEALLDGDRSTREADRSRLTTPRPGR